MKFAETLAIKMGLPELRLCTNVQMYENQLFYQKLGFDVLEHKVVAGYDRIYYYKNRSAEPAFSTARKDHAPR